MSEHRLPWNEPSENQLIRLRNDRGSVIANSVETITECIAITLGYSIVTIQVYVAARKVVFDMMGIQEEAEVKPVRGAALGIIEGERDSDYWARFGQGQQPGTHR